MTINPTTPSAVIWRFPLPSPGHQKDLLIPLGWNVVHVENRQMWVWVNPGAPKETITIQTMATGSLFSDKGTPLGTWLEGPFVWHAIQVNIR